VSIEITFFVVPIFIMMSMTSVNAVHSKSSVWIARPAEELAE
jgi:hypothetical protein